MISKVPCSAFVLYFSAAMHFNASGTPIQMLLVISYLITKYLFTEPTKRSRQILERFVLLRRSRLPFIITIFIV